MDKIGQVESSSVRLESDALQGVLTFESVSEIKYKARALHFIGSYWQ